jgi:O-antigen ligase
MADIEIWRDNPLFGVGPGMAKGMRGLYYSRAGTNSAHTEFTRLLSEHGLLGVSALLLLLWMGARNLLRARTTKGKALVGSMMAWSCLYMLNAAMRLVAPAFTFGLMFATFSEDFDPVNPRRVRRPINRNRPGPHHRPEANRPTGPTI